MKLNKNQSMEDVAIYEKKFSNKNIKNYIFREYNRTNNSFIATNNFYLSEEIDNGRLEFNEFNVNNNYKKNHNKIRQMNNNLYTYINNNNNSTENFLKTYLDLIVISNISFSIEDTNISKSEIIKKFIENNSNIDEKFINELYYNKKFSEKINIELPKKYNNQTIILEDIEVNKKYLFKVNIKELNCNFSKEILC